MNESLRNLPLKKLKEKAVNLGIRGTTSRTKYTKNNRSKLIDDITAREVIKSGKNTENLIGDFEKSVEKSEKSEELCNPISFKSIKDTKVKKTENLIPQCVSEAPENDDENSISWIIGGVLAVMGAAISVIFVKLLNSKESKTPKVGNNIINNI